MLLPPLPTSPPLQFGVFLVRPNFRYRRHFPLCLDPLRISSSISCYFERRSPCSGENNCRHFGLRLEGTLKLLLLLYPAPPALFKIQVSSPTIRLVPIVVPFFFCKLRAWILSRHRLLPQSAIFSVFCLKSSRLSEWPRNPSPLVLTWLIGRNLLGNSCGDEGATSRGNTLLYFCKITFITLFCHTAVWVWIYVWGSPVCSVVISIFILLWLIKLAHL